jgi:hypothetical protein
MPSRPQNTTLVLWIIVALIGPLGFAHSSNAVPEKITEPHPASFSFLTDHEPVISLDGLWRFHPGDDAGWASPAFEDSAWPLLRSDEPWTDQGYNQLSGFAWYRFRVQAPAPAIPLSLLLPSILTDYEVFENGVKIGGFITPSTQPTWEAAHAMPALIWEKRPCSSASLDYSSSSASLGSPASSR